MTYHFRNGFSLFRSHSHKLKVKSMQSKKITGNISWGNTAHCWFHVFTGQTRSWYQPVWTTVVLTFQNFYGSLLAEILEDVYFSTPVDPCSDLEVPLSNASCSTN